MGRTAWGARGCAAVALMACCLTVTASAQQASAPPPPAGSTSAVPAELPISVERVRDHLSREPAIRLDSQPIFRLEVNEWRPRYWDLQSPFFFEVGPRDSTTQWHNEFLAMTTPDEARMYSPMQSSGETAQLIATGMLFAGAAKLVTAGVNKWRDGRRAGKARAARAEVDAALAALEAVNQGAGVRPD